MQDRASREVEVAYCEGKAREVLLGEKKVVKMIESCLLREE